MTEEHRCRAKDDCAAITSEGSAITAKASTLCHSCVDKLQGQLDKLPVFRQALESFKKKSLVPQGGGAKVSSSSTEGTTPINLHIVDLIDEIEEILTWVGGSPIATLILRPEENHKIWRRDRWAEVALDGIIVALRVGQVWKKAEGAIGVERVWERRFGACPKCTLQTLGAFSGSSSIQCSSCGGVMSRDEYDRITIIRSKK